MSREIGILRSDGDKLRLLADWLDAVPKNPSYIVDRIDWSNCEVQDDLRVMATRLDELDRGVRSE